MEERKTVGQRLSDLIGMGFRGLGWLVDRFLGEVETTLRLFSNVPPMFVELILAVFFLLAYLFPGEDMEKLIVFVGTELAIPFVLGLFYSVLNFIWVIYTRGRDVGWGWYYSFFKASVFPTGLAWALFSNRAFQQFVGWGDPAATLQFCLWLVWGVVLANALAVQLKARVTAR